MFLQHHQNKWTLTHIRHIYILFDFTVAYTHVENKLDFTFYPFKLIIKYWWNEVHPNSVLYLFSLWYHILQLYKKDQCWLDKNK